MDNEPELTEKRNVTKTKKQEKKKCVEYTLVLFKVFQLENNSESGSICDSFSMEPMKDMGPTALV